MAMRTEFKARVIPGFVKKGAPGMPPLGRVPGPDGTIVSARLNPEDVEAALLDTDTTNDVTATLSDVVDAAEKSEPEKSSPYGYAGGARRKVRGGGKTYDALAALFTGVENTFTTGMGVADKATAFAIGVVPGLLKTAVAGGALKYVLNHPSLFANIVDLAKELAKTILIVKSGEGVATWSDYLEAGKSIGGSFADFIVTAAQQPTTPAGTILLALFIMKYRASSAGLSLTDLVKSDAAVLKNLATIVADDVSTATMAQYSAFLKEYEVGSQKKAAAELERIAQRVRAPMGEGSKQLSVVASTGAPSVQSGPDGAIQAVPATKRKAFTEALKKLTEISAKKVEKVKVPPKEAEAMKPVLAAAAAVAPVAVDVAPVAAEAANAEALANAGQQGGRRRKTKKRSVKRRITRRARKYLAAPVFVY